MHPIAIIFVLFHIIGIFGRNIKFEREVLDEHNKHRASHNAQNLKLDEKLSKNATLSAKKAAESGSFDSISPGQSVFVSCATFKREVTGKEVTDAWYGEVCNPEFDFKNPDNEKTRGFTQLVWKDTARIGIGKGIGRGKNGEICVYIVGVYRPPGNLVGFFDENVDVGTFDKDEYCKEGEEDSDDDDDDDDDTNDGTKGKEIESKNEEEDDNGDEEKETQVAVKDKTKKFANKSKPTNNNINNKQKR